ncbi:MAG: aminoacyl-tRNA hydrolase [Coriobacteriales bacterium]|jgi:PTH1 family peptidyl-tRNA hydrolase|nr:aminoacyl-tRNA hydrolase [Coriobacteriales bacterium]
MPGRAASAQPQQLPGPHLIVGLGNPGPEYQNTRHNAGFKVVDVLAEELGVNYWKTAGEALCGETTLSGDKIVLVKPLKFMNLSGGPVKGACKRYGMQVGDLLIIHDELDLPVGTLRFKQGGGHAGHNGLRSIHEAIGPDYARLRVGIGRPPGRMNAADYVLQKLSGEVLEQLDVTAAEAAALTRQAIEQGI